MFLGEAMTSAIIVMYDAEPELDAWMHGPHYHEVLAIPGVTGVRRLRVVDGPSDNRKYMAIIETEDLAATQAWRNGPAGQRSQADANDRGVSRRCGMTAEVIFDSTAQTIPSR
jgi:heme-degrading monooxygenase HmoA